jgi:hypothetical protein
MQDQPHDLFSLSGAGESDSLFPSFGDLGGLEDFLGGGDGSDGQFDFSDLFSNDTGDDISNVLKKFSEDFDKGNNVSPAVYFSMESLERNTELVLKSEFIKQIVVISACAVRSCIISIQCFLPSRQTVPPVCHLHHGGRRR